jgi:hypothetical protein
MGPMNFTWEIYAARDAITAEFNAPLWSDDEWGPHETERVYVEVDYGATDEQLVSDFRRWLAHMRDQGFTTASSRAYTMRDFQRWIDLHVLPHFDLTTIARIEGSPLQQHVIGQTLFPDDVDVDVTERVRKVVQPLAKRIFTSQVERALRLQAAESE